MRESADRRGRGHDETYSDFVTSHQQALLGFAQLVCGDYHQAQDLVQTALVKIFLRWKKLQHLDHLDGYIRRVIINENTNVWRRAWKKLERSTGEVPEQVTRGESPRVEDLAWHHVLSLPPRQRTTVALRFYEDRSEAEVADIMGCSVGTVKSQTAKALAKLREKISVDELEGR